jgi:hypothetical protein
MFVEKIYKMGCLEGCGVPVLYIGRTVPKGGKKSVAQLSFSRTWLQGVNELHINSAGPEVTFAPHS